MRNRFAIHLAVASVLTLGTGLIACAGTNQTYVNYDSPYVAGYLQIGDVADYWWANSFIAPADGEYLTRLDASFGEGFAVGTPVSVIVYEDPSDSNNPNDLQLVTETTGTVASNNGSDLFSPQAFFIPATYVTGDFFVAVEANNVPASAYGPAVSPTKPQGRGFMAYNYGTDAGTMTPTNINNADQPPASIDEIGAGTATPTYNLFIGARGRSTQYAEAQDPMVLDGYNTGTTTVTASQGGDQVTASDAMGGNRGITFTGSGYATVANGALTVTNGQASVFYGGQYNGGSGYQFGLNTYMHLNASGYDTLQFHFLQPNSTVLMIVFGGNNGAPNSYTTDANGNVDFNIAGQDWSDLNTFDYTIYSYGGSVSLDSLTLLTNPIPGDVNGDGVLNADDYALIDRGYAAGLTGHINGDLNGDGVINAADYLIIDTAFGQANGDTFSPSFLAERESEFGASYVSELEAAVPEPASIAICGLALPLLLRRRR